jgi:hypothetical protein
MICSECGREFDGNKATHDYRYETRGDAYAKMVPMILCPSCVGGRGAILMWFVYFLIAVVLGALVVGAVAMLVF